MQDSHINSLIKHSTTIKESYNWGHLKKKKDMLNNKSTSYYAWKDKKNTTAKYSIQEFSQNMPQLS